LLEFLLARSGEEVLRDPALVVFHSTVEQIDVLEQAVSLETGSLAQALQPLRDVGQRLQRVGHRIIDLGPPENSA